MTDLADLPQTPEPTMPPPGVSGPQATWSNMEELAALHEQMWAEAEASEDMRPRGPHISLSDAVDFKPHFKSDPKGASVTFRVPEQLRRLIDILIQKEGIPHETLTDFARDACYHYAETLVSMFQLQDQRIKMAIMRERINADSMFLADEQARMAETVESVHNYLSGLMDAGAATEGERALKFYYDMADEQLGHWRETYLRAISGLTVVQTWLEVLTETGIQVPWHGYARSVQRERERAASDDGGDAESGVRDDPGGRGDIRVPDPGESGDDDTECTEGVQAEREEAECSDECSQWRDADGCPLHS